jgi:hypothetical protein
LRRESHLLERAYLRALALLVDLLVRVALDA